MAFPLEKHIRGFLDDIRDDIREFLDGDLASYQGYAPPQQGVPNPKGGTSHMPGVFSNFGPAPRQPRQGTSDSANWASPLPGSTDRLSHRLVADLQEALGPAPGGRPRDPATFAHLPEILYRIRPDVLRRAVQHNAWTKQEAQHWRDRDPGISQGELHEILGHNVFYFLRANAPELTDGQAKWLAYHLGEAKHPEEFCDISARMHSPSGSITPQPPASINMAQPSVSHSPPSLAGASPAAHQPAPQSTSRAAGASAMIPQTRLVDELTIEMVENGNAPGTLKEIRRSATTLLSRVDTDVLQRAVILEVISKQWEENKIVCDLARASPETLPKILDHVIRALQASGVSIKEEWVHDAVAALRQTIPRKSLTVEHAGAIKDPKNADNMIISRYMFDANSKPFATTVVSGALRRMPHPEQLLGGQRS